MKACNFLENKYNVSIKTLTTLFENSVFLIEKQVLFWFLKILGVEKDIEG